MKFISHLELIRVIERALRRAQIPLSFSQGYNPHPKIAFASPLSVGVSSEGEYLNIELDEQIDLKEFKEKINSQLPKGITFMSCKYVDEKSKSLMSVVSFASYVVKCEFTRDYDKIEIQDKINNFLKKEEITYTKTSKKTKKIKTINIREMIKELSLQEMEEEYIYLKMILSTGSKDNLKPEIVIEKFMEGEGVNMDTNKMRFHRLDLFSLDEDNALISIENTN